MDEPLPDLDESPAERRLRLRLEEQERQIQELWRRLHVISDMIEERDQH